MKKILSVALLAAASATTTFANDVGVSISIGQPGFYGRIDIGDYPQPTVIYREPRVIERGYDDRAPIYMRVPPGHAKHWDKHCREYHACGERVFFVQDGWYTHEYAPRYKERHGNKHDDHRHDEQHRDDHHDDHGNDNGHGNGNGKDHGH